MADAVPPKDLYAVAYALCDGGQYRKAQPLIERFLAGNPESWRGWCVASWAAYSIGDSTAALEYAARAIALAPEKEWPVRSYSLALRGLGRIGAALEFARKAVELEPEEVLGWRCLAESSRYFGLPDEALAAAKQASTVAPDNVHAMYAWVAAAAGMDRTEGVTIVLRALEREPTSVALLRELAILYSNEGLLEEAQDLFRRVLGQNPRDNGAHHWYLAIRGASGIEGSAQAYREFFEREFRSNSSEREHRSTDFRTFNLLADIARQLGLLDDAVALAREASVHPPGEQFVGVWRTLAFTACAVDQWPLALFAINQAFELDPTSPLRWLEAAEVSLLSGDVEQASHWAERVIDEQPSCSYVLKAQAIIAQCRKDFEAASKFLELFVMNWPFASCNSSQLAHCRAEMGDRYGALDIWDEANKRDPFCNCAWRQRAAASMARIGIRLEEEGSHR